MVISFRNPVCHCKDWKSSSMRSPFTYTTHSFINSEVPHFKNKFGFELSHYICGNNAFKLFLISFYHDILKGRSSNSSILVSGKSGQGWFIVLSLFIYHSDQRRYPRILVKNFISLDPSQMRLIKSINVLTNAFYLKVIYIHI